MTSITRGRGWIENMEHGNHDVVVARLQIGRHSDGQLADANKSGSGATRLHLHRSTGAKTSGDAPYEGHNSRQSTNVGVPRICFSPKGGVSFRECWLARSSDCLRRSSKRAVPAESRHSSSRKRQCGSSRYCLSFRSSRSAGRCGWSYHGSPSESSARSSIIFLSNPARLLPRHASIHRLHKHLCGPRPRVRAV